MRTVSDIQNEDAIELLAEIIEPAAEILADKDMRRMLSEKGIKKSHIVSCALKNHKTHVIEILAALEGVEPAEYKGNILSITKQCLELLNDKEISAFFQSALAEEMGSASSGSATESTEGSGE